MDIRVENVVPFTSNLHSVAFVNVKFHLPGEFPLGYRIKVSLQKGGIAFGFDAAVEDAIISKETDYCSYLLAESFTFCGRNVHEIRDVSAKNCGRNGSSSWPKRPVLNRNTGVPVSVNTEIHRNIPKSTEIHHNASIG